ncbi:MAG: hypothetical protein GXC73_14455 [Chitinophagaceae bacterium]|nr:hypothetical protein [Chitinophagaceae bacterium]
MMSRKKIFYPVSEPLQQYLRLYHQSLKFPVSYDDLKYYAEAIPLLDKFGKDTLWETVIYPQSEVARVHDHLKVIYAKLKAGGDLKALRHLYIERIDYCTFGNSHPYRIKIVNKYNDVYDYFYIKTADASRVYGLELETLLSPNPIHYLCDGSTLVEEHIAGIPGDQFIKLVPRRPEYNLKRIAKEFVKFNERCFLRLLGDMRSYNFVFIITPDFDDYKFFIRAIDFDQQFYEGSKNIYLPQFFKENYAFVEMAQKHLNREVIQQYQQEERAVIARRIREERYRLKDLRDVLVKDQISTPEKIQQLGHELALHYDDPVFARCKSMGEIIDRSLKRVLIRTHTKGVKIG